MKSIGKHKPHFLKRELGFLFGFTPAVALLLIQMGCATSSVIKMPKPPPDVVKSHKSVYVVGGHLGMKNTGVKVTQGDYITILAKGTIDLWPQMGRIRGPKGLLSYKSSEKDWEHTYFGPELIEIKKAGSIYVSYGENHPDPQNHRGSFLVDIIVWKTNDEKLIEKFLEDTSSAQPKDKELREMVREFKSRQESERISAGLQEKTKEIEVIKQALSIVEGKKGSEEHVSAVAQKTQEEKKIVEELRERLQKAMQSLKELEEMKKKLTEREEKEAQLLARLETMEKERSIQSKNIPVIAVAYPRDGISVDSEYVSLFGVAEHEKGISKFEIFVNNKPAGLRDKDLQLNSRDRKRIEFSERLRLKEGQNTISIIVQGTEGLTSQKTISIQLTRKQENVYAVVIGINKYKNLPFLKYAVNDAREFYRYLVEVNQVPKDHIWLLLDEEASLDKLKTTLGTLLRRRAGKDDTVIIFLAGHGATEKDASSPDGDGLEKYILPHNADPNDLYASAMPMSEVARIFQRISSERLVFIGDTCYSGGSGGRTILAGTTRANVSGTFLERLSQGKGRVILTASDANEVSVEKDELNHGVFTYYLLEGLRGKADLDGDGVITVDEIYRYVSDKVPPATGQDQHPVKKGETTGQIVLGVVK